ncbi:MAG: hypothetical protein ABI054_14160 [Planctomycetota bacterium]
MKEKVVASSGDGRNCEAGRPNVSFGASGEVRERDTHAASATQRAAATAMNAIGSAHIRFKRAFTASASRAGCGTVHLVVALSPDEKELWALQSSPPTLHRFTLPQ